MYRPRHVIALFTTIALGILKGEAQGQGAVPAPPAREHFSEETLALQGVWTLLDPEESSVVFARLVIHGSYFLLIYQFEGKEAREVEIQGFRVDDRIRNREGEPVLDYDFSEDRIVHIEVRNESRYALSDHMYLSFKRTGWFPDLGLSKAGN
jgi:hypothetical protein